MLSRAEKLDKVFDWHTLEIQRRYLELSKAERIRIDRWLQKLSAVARNMSWKKARNEYSRLLLDMVVKKKLVTPFDKLPSDYDDLGQLPAWMTSNMDRTLKSWQRDLDTEFKVLRELCDNLGGAGRDTQNILRAGGDKKKVQKKSTDHDSQLPSRSMTEYSEVSNLGQFPSTWSVPADVRLHIEHLERSLFEKEAELKRSSTTISLQRARVEELEAQIQQEQSRRTMEREELEYCFREQLGNLTKRCEMLQTHLEAVTSTKDLETVMLEETYRRELGMVKDRSSNPKTSTSPIHRFSPPRQSPAAPMATSKIQVANTNVSVASVDSDEEFLDYLRKFERETERLTVGALDSSLRG